MNKTYQVGEMASARAVIGDTLCSLAEKNPAIWALTSDCGGNLQEYAKLYPDRYVDTGIAEQSAADIAAGLALAGAIPHIMGMAPFVTMRCFEQNRTSIGYQNLPVRIIGTCGGMSSGGGSTHYAMEDVAIMRSIPNMSVVSISDPVMAGAALRVTEAHPGPVYIRLALGKSDPVIYTPDEVAFMLGKGYVVRNGTDATILTHGAMVRHAMQLSDKMAAENIGIRVVDMMSIKPIDRELVLQCVRETERIIVWEDHLAFGGMASAVADVLVDVGMQPKHFRRVGIPETYPGFGADQDLYRKYNMDADFVMQVVRDIL